MTKLDVPIARARRVSSRRTSRPKEPAVGSAGSAGRDAVAAGSAGSAPIRGTSRPIDRDARDAGDTQGARAGGARARRRHQPKLAKVRELPLEHAGADRVPDDRGLPQVPRAARSHKELPPRRRRPRSRGACSTSACSTSRSISPTTLEQTMVTQAAAYYDPAQKKFFVVMAPDNDMHARHDVGARADARAAGPELRSREVPAAPKLDDDQANARQFVVEGDATFAMLALRGRGERAGARRRDPRR